MISATKKDDKYILVVDNVDAYINKYHLLSKVSLSVLKGKITLLLGRNGAGKTTCLRSIMGLTTIKNGQILYKNTNIVGHKSYQLTRQKISYIPESIGIFNKLTVEENLEVASYAKSINKEKIDWIFSFFPDLHKFYSSLAGNLSGGQKKMLAIARALINPIDLMIVDEPSIGLAPSILSRISDMFLHLNKNGTSILLVEQNLSFAKSLGHYAYIMDDGRSIYNSNASKLFENKTYLNKYLNLN